MKVLVSGANGFIGRALCPYLSSLGHAVVPAVRRPCDMAGAHVVGDEASWKDALEGCDSVVHLAGRAHVMRDQAVDPLQAFRAANVDATLALAYLAAKAGVRRFVFMSTIKVNGEHTAPGTSFGPADAPAPEDPYGRSKWEAEEGLLEIARASELEVVIVRPPMVYGPGAKGNFATLVKCVRKGLPLPLGAVHNRRSLVALDNLLSLTALCADRTASPAAANQIFLVSDGRDVSTTELLRAIAGAYGRSLRLIPVPVGLICLGARLLGKTATTDRLLGSLAVDDSKTRDLLGWRPQVSMGEQLRKMANAATD
ncbi:NAD-dependent epimerase/dehydratase [Burkholderia sp. lig30]|jgi:nucleoside-diphosphate-sugar epimerase|uniref:UDP-glucose 4-epimerase family protein n=1 Tax=Burkholderia sp. lig30 TaxID=1192124 RepID=UPI0004615AAA|nr:SDR family oxidoreductase [Burkholderia sp. lig30]KDB08737.1 NAD-dependent epimerase/dehydratase [Burkholderia sp. lig30]